MGVEATAIEGAYKAGGITLAICVALLIGLVAVFRLWRVSENRSAALREGDHQQTRSDLAVLQRNCTAEVAALNAARLADQREMNKILLEEVHAQRDALESAASAGRDQAEALEAQGRMVGELRVKVESLTQEVIALRVAEAAKTKGGRT